MCEISFILPVHSDKPCLCENLFLLNGAVMRKAWRPRASLRTGGKLIMWKMRAWKAVVGVCMGADKMCPPCAQRSWTNWEQDQPCSPLSCLPGNPCSHPTFPYLYYPPSVSKTITQRPNCFSSICFLSCSLNRFPEKCLINLLY